MFSSIAARPGSVPSISAIATNWSSSSPAILAITAVPTVRRYGRWCSMKMGDPVVVQADRVEQPRGRLDRARGRVARRGRNVTVLGITPPSRSRRTNGSISRT